MYGWGMPAAVYAVPAEPFRQDEEEIRNIQISTSAQMGPNMAEYFDNELLSDIDICSEQGQVYHCHKLMLIRWSEPLRRMLTGDMLEGHQRSAIIRGVESEVLGAFLRFMYTCSCSLPTEKLVALTALADQYDITLLTRLCMDAIRGHLHNQRCCCLFYKAAKEVQQLDILQLAWEALSNNLGSLVRQHAVFVQLELDDVLLLCGRGAAAAAGSSSAAAGGAGSSSIGPPLQALYAGASSVRPNPIRPEYLLFLALMAWLDNKPERQQHKQQLLDCVDFDQMNNYELSQVRHHPHVQTDDALKELLLDAYSRRCLATSQQPMYHMQPLGVPLARTASLQQQQQQQSRPIRPPGVDHAQAEAAAPSLPPVDPAEVAAAAAGRGAGDHAVAVDREVLPAEHAGVPAAAMATPEVIAANITNGIVRLMNQHGYNIT